MSITVPCLGIERRDLGLELFGKARKGAEELKEDLAAELLAFQSSSSLNDDQTFLIMAE